ncbi:MAG: hypothetical protein WDO15_19895 [Bacteroidota bacterium]
MDFLIDHLKKSIEERSVLNGVALAVTPNERSVAVDYFIGGTIKRIEAKHVIVAVPTFVAKHLVRSQRDVDYNAFQYAPWMVANIMVDSWLGDRRGEPLAWDNVIYGSKSLGYVSAQHQNVEMPSREKMITYYRALTGADCAAMRKMAMETIWEGWRDSVFADLKLAHRDIEKYATQMDVWTWGHGMIRPSPGFVWGGIREKAKRSVENKIFFAHSDLSGISIFEEAFESGILAATDVMKHA